MSTGAGKLVGMTSTETHHQFEVLSGPDAGTVFVETLGAHAGMAAWARLNDRVSVRLFGHTNVQFVGEADAGIQVRVDRRTRQTILVQHREVQAL